jgi:hypothetical protein
MLHPSLLINANTRDFGYDYNKKYYFHAACRHFQPTIDLNARQLAAS